MTMEKKLSAQTRMAICVYEKLRKTQFRIAKLEKQLNYWIAKVPEEDLEEYFVRTNEIDEKFEEKEAKLK